MAKDGLTHLDDRGRARMVDVGEKRVTERVCVARGEVRMAAETLKQIADGAIPKGDVLATARLAGIGRHGNGYVGVVVVVDTRVAADIADGRCGERTVEHVCHGQRQVSSGRVDSRSCSVHLNCVT